MSEPAFEQDVPLAPLTSLEVGGRARYFLRAESENALREALLWAESRRLRVHLLGGGSNIVVSEAGFSGLVVQVALRGVEWGLGDAGAELIALAGEPWDGLVAEAVRRDLQGLECLSGIPGLVGATPIQNVGAYGQEISDTLVSVRVFDRIERQTLDMSTADCAFAYRDSRFKSGEPERYVVLSVRFRLRPGHAPSAAYAELERSLSAERLTSPTLSDVRRMVIELRRKKSMVIESGDPNRRSCGSFFVNPIVDEITLADVRRRAADPSMPVYPQADGRAKLSAAWLIEHAGFYKGQRFGQVGLSTRHALALVCHEGARSEDVVSAARTVRNGVRRRFAVKLVPEPNFWGFFSLDAGLPDDRLAS